MTIAESLGIYDEIHRHYTSSNDNSATAKLDKLDMKRLSEILAHKKEDFIYG
jgi:hypothetical protein